MTADRGLSWQSELFTISYENELDRLEGKKTYYRKRHDRLGFLGRMVARKYGASTVEELKRDGVELALKEYKGYNRNQ